MLSTYGCLDICLAARSSNPCGQYPIYDSALVSRLDMVVIGSGCFHRKLQAPGWDQSGETHCTSVSRRLFDLHDHLHDQQTFQLKIYA